jgi:hypothetical protein
VCRIDLTQFCAGICVYYVNAGWFETNLTPTRFLSAGLSIECILGSPLTDLSTDI